MPHHLMAAPKTTINDVLGILNAVNKWAYSSRNIATVALKGLVKPNFFAISPVVFAQTCATELKE
jgi:hypothetical protein